MMILKTKGQHKFAALYCDPGGIQTPDFQNRNLTFYSAELRGQSGCKDKKVKKISDFFAILISNQFCFLTGVDLCKSA